MQERDEGEDDGPHLVALVPADWARRGGAAALVPVLLYLAGEVGVLEVCAFGRDREGGFVRWVIVLVWMVCSLDDWLCAGG